MRWSQRLQAAEAALEDPAAAVSGWQLDPIYMGNTTVTRADLDRVSTTRPVGVSACLGPYYEREHQSAGTGWHA